MNDLSSRVALVTGASSGIGRAIAQDLAAAGAKIVLVARSADKLEALAAEIRATGGTALVAPADITIEAEVIGTFAAAMAGFGRLDLLVNNAGIADHTPTAELPLTLWQKVIDINLTAVFLCCREALKIMKTQKRGRIINIGSVSARVPRPHTISYVAAKCALEGMTHSIALDHRADGITCSILHPGVTESHLAGASPREPRPPSQMMAAADVARTVTLMAQMPDETNLMEALMLPIAMPFLGRG
jgi:NAD(P)-dependent dehydrogenase (short-subunit alcohol dehydrogenase family)